MRADCELANVVRGISWKSQFDYTKRFGYFGGYMTSTDECRDTLSFLYVVYYVDV